MTTELDPNKSDANYLEGLKLAVVDAIEDIKGFDITVMDVRKLTSMTSYMIVASATSSRQAKAIADDLKTAGAYVAADKEIIALIAYLQRLGRSEEVGAARPAQ